jgi:hypothetical protein
MSREEFYELVWANPMTKLAKKFGLSDVALHKICRKHTIPKPPQGYWAKKAHGKPVVARPLLPGKNTMIVINDGAGAHESEAVVTARSRVEKALTGDEFVPGQDWSDPILERSLAFLAKGKSGPNGLILVKGPDLVTISVRPETVPRAQTILSQLVQLAHRAGVHLVATDGGATWNVDGIPVGFGLHEITDRLEHIPTEKERRAVAKWEAEAAAYFKRTGYSRDWGRPNIPKWEERYQGRLSVILEEVRDRTTNAYWGAALRRKFSDSKTRDVTKALPQVVATIAAMGVTKRENAAADEARRIIHEENERRRRETERRAAIEHARQAGLKELLAHHATRSELANWLTHFERQFAGRSAPQRVERLQKWAQERLASLDAAVEPNSLEQWLLAKGLFGEDGA